MNVDITPTDGFPHMYDYVNGATEAATANPLVLIILTLVGLGLVLYTYA